MSNKPIYVYIGFDPREAAAFAVARESIRNFDRHLRVEGVVLSRLRAAGLYIRPTEVRLGKLWDVISDAHMSTEFAISRFFVPELMRRRDHHGWALFMDCDVLVRANINQLRPYLDDSKAVCCVKHEYIPTNDIKMDGQIQSAYPRKNWSSVMAINVDHPANDALNLRMVNSLPGRDLHAFWWITDDKIGELPPEWNYIPGHTKLPEDTYPRLVHYTDGGPWLPQFRNVEYAEEWLTEFEQWAA
jgi:lipopolysaccharide biosynthesis glycosyltransferase